MFLNINKDNAYIFDIVHAGELAISYIGKYKEIESFNQDTQCQDAVIRRLEIIGEAAKRLSEDVKAKRPTIPWSEMVGMRNIVTHNYDGVDLTIIWDTVKNDLPIMIQLIKTTFNHLF
ncbi:MAG: DUF86 domain-containing protein [Deltaproteobacteria bacterium]|nr:MAG: DUF86 domain-containing protein [Deltaproteobacteria bacterium]